MFQLLGQAQNYYFNDNHFLSFVNGWIFIESSINMLWRELIRSTFDITGSKKKGTPLDDVRNWTTQIKIDELFMKGIINEDLRKKLHRLRKRRNSIFHYDEKVSKRKVSREDAGGIIEYGLKMFYMMIEGDLEKVPAFMEIRNNIYKNIHRGTIHRTVIKEKGEK